MQQSTAEKEFPQSERTISGFTVYEFKFHFRKIIFIYYI